MINKIKFNKTNVFLLLFLVSCLLTRINYNFFIIDVFGQFGFQIFLCGIVLLIFFLISKKFWAAMICFFACILLLTDILSSCKQCNARIKAKSQNYKTIRLMTFNTSYYENCKFYRCITCIKPIEFKRKGCLHNRFKNFDSLLDLIAKEKPDIINFQEVSPILQKKIYSLKSIFPYSLGLNRDLGIFDSVIVSKYPLMKKEIKANHILKAELVIDQTEITILSIHLIKPGNQNELKLSLESMNKLETIINNINQNIILLGDLNLTRSSKRFTKFLDETNLYTYVSYNNPTLTWPTFLPNYIGLQLDHVLFTNNLKLIKKKIMNNFGSDHRPLLVDLAF